MITLATTALRASTAAAHRSTASAFLLNGLLLATWMTKIQSIKESAGLSVGGLGTALAVPVLASLLAMQLVGRSSSPLPSRIVMVGCIPVTAIALYATSLAHDGVELGGALLVFGLADGLLYVAMNMQGAAVERAGRRPRMSFYHAAWSVGTLLGGLTGGAFAWAGADAQLQFLVVALLATTASVPMAVGLRSAHGLGIDDPPAKTTGGHSLGLNREVLVLGLLGLCCLVAQGAIQDWGTVFLHERRSATPVVAASGFIAFSSAMTGVRLYGDRIRAALPSGVLLRAFAVLASAGMALSLAVPSAIISVAGFGVFGAGLSLLDPVISSAAANGQKGPVTASIAHVATLSQTGLLLGPPVIGWLADWVGLTEALLLPTLLILAVGAVAPHLSVFTADPYSPASAPVVGS